MTIQYYLFNSQLTLVDHLNEYQTARIILSSHFRCYFDPHPYLPFKDGMCNSRNSQDKGGTYSVFTFNQNICLHICVILVWPSFIEQR